MPVDADLAVRFERLTGAEPTLYLHMQDEIELWNARGRLATTLNRIKPAAPLPIKQGQ